MGAAMAMERGNNDLVGLGKELAKSVLEALDRDAHRHLLEDREHIVRLRQVLEAMVGCWKTHGMPSRQSELVQQELKSFAVELFIRRCRAARISHGESHDPEKEASDREYFENFYRSRKRR
jgi:hypothetical protein